MGCAAVGAVQFKLSFHAGPHGDDGMQLRGVRVGGAPAATPSPSFSWVSRQPPSRQLWPVHIQCILPSPLHSSMFQVLDVEPTERRPRPSHPRHHDELGHLAAAASGSLCGHTRLSITRTAADPVCGPISSRWPA